MMFGSGLIGGVICSGVAWGAMELLCINYPKPEEPPSYYFMPILYPRQCLCRLMGHCMRTDLGMGGSCAGQVQAKNEAQKKLNLPCTSKEGK